MHHQSVRLAALAAGCFALVLVATGSARAQTIDLETPAQYCSGQQFCSSDTDEWYVHFVDANLSGGRGIMFDATEAFELISVGVAYDLSGSTTLSFELWTVDESNDADMMVDDTSMLFSDVGEAFYDAEFDPPIMLSMGERYLIWVSDSTTPNAARLFSYEGRGDLGIGTEGPYQVGPVSVFDGTGPPAVDGMNVALGHFRLNALPEPDAAAATVSALATLLLVRRRSRS